MPSDCEKPLHPACAPLQTIAVAVNGRTGVFPLVSPFTDGFQLYATEVSVSKEERARQVV